MDPVTPQSPGSHGYSEGRPPTTPAHEVTSEAWARMGLKCPQLS